MPNLTITSQPDAQVLLIGGDLKVERRGVGRLVADVPPGFYKVKAERGGGTVEQLIELDGDKALYLAVGSFPAIAPIAPLLGGDAAAIEALGAQVLVAPAVPWSAHWAAALAPCLGSPGEPGLLVLAHRAHAEAGDPLAGLRLGRWKGPEMVDLPAMGTADAAGERWAGAWLPLRPACYLLEISDADQKVLQAVPVAPGWQTRVFLRRRQWLSGPAPLPEEAGRRDWIDVSIQMARPGAAMVYSDHLETVEVARNALELTRPNFIAVDLVEALLSGKFDNPVAGITGLHLFLEALERSPAPETAEAGRRVQIDDATRAHAPQIIREGLGNLERLLGADTPDGAGAGSDLIALKLRAGLLPAGRTVVDEPPMFWVSWDVLRRNSDVAQPVEVSPELWRRIAFANAWGPYLAWPPRETSLEDFLDRQLRSAVGPREGFTLPVLRSKSVLGHVLRAIEPMRRTRRPSLPMLEGTELAKALGIPASVAMSSRKRDEEA